MVAVSSILLFFSVFKLDCASNLSFYMLGACVFIWKSASLHHFSTSLVIMIFVDGGLFSTISSALVSQQLQNSCIFLYDIEGAKADGSFILSAFWGGVFELWGSSLPVLLLVHASFSLVSALKLFLTA